MNLSEKMVIGKFAPTNQKQFCYFKMEDVQKSIREILFHKKCFDCGLNLCNCGEHNFGVNINVIKEEFGDVLVSQSEVGE